MRLPRSAGFRDTVRFTIDYRGKVVQGRGSLLLQGRAGRPTPDPQQVYSGGGTDGNPNWIPTYAGPQRQGDLGAGRPGAGRSHGGLERPAGERQTRSVRGGAPGARRSRTHTVHWRQERPASTYLISLVVAPLTKVTDRWRDVPLEYYVYPEDLPLARRLFGVTPDMMETFTRLTGVKYPWAGYSQATVYRLHRWHGERRRNHPGGLAARRTGLS